MKIMFLVFHGFGASNGISKKIGYQVEALRALGHRVELGSVAVDGQGHWKRMCDDHTVEDFGTGIAGKLKKRYRYGSLARYIAGNGFDLIYMRSDHNANPFTIRMAKRIRKAGVVQVMEVPTYPYDQEYQKLLLKDKAELLVDRIFRRRLAAQLDAIVTFSDFDSIFGRRTIRISNGVSYDRIPVRKERPFRPDEIRLVAVADIGFWHGFDRLVNGMADYYARDNRTADVYLSIVGSGRADVLGELHRIVAENGLQERVRFTGPLFGDALDGEFDRADMAVGSLGRHRSGITNIKTLKNREYAVRGIPFVYSEYDSDFERMPYILKAPADDSPLDIGALVAFCRENRFPASQIRESVRFLSWEEQMRTVVEQSMKLK